MHIGTVLKDSSESDDFRSVARELPLDLDRDGSLKRKTFWGSLLKLYQGAYDFG